MNCESCGIPLAPESSSKLDVGYCVYRQNQETGELPPRCSKIRGQSYNTAICTAMTP